MILVIDNFDSFTYNLVQIIGDLGHEVKVFRNNAITVEKAEAMHPDYLVISPGPCTPKEAGVSVEMVRRFAGKIPILGVCLGHQAIGAAFGARIVRASSLMHGKLSEIRHDGKTIYSDLPPVFLATRYHSLAVDTTDLPGCLQVSAQAKDGEIMGLRHRRFEVEGVQFHPESVATQVGRKIIENFLARTKESTTLDMRQVLSRVSSGENLTTEEMTSAMRIIMEGRATQAQIGSFITALKMKGETIVEISAAAAVMREKAQRVSVPRDVTVVDTCGTGGDGAQTFNISTLSALTAAGAGVTVAKHGNRCVSSQCGSADVLKELGVNIEIDASKMSTCLEKAGIGFLFAPTLHSAMRHVIGPRREIGVRTNFNILGPLANPAFADAQVLGVYDKELIAVMAEVLKNLGCRRALVVHGSDGLDEITLTGKSYATELNEGTLSDTIIDPESFGFRYCRADQIKGGTVQENAKIAMDILSGKERGPRRDIVLINAGAAIYVSGKTDTMSSAIEMARESIDSKTALAKLDLLRKVSSGN
jgi:anthranilate synthase/phosphoribosyltransferase